jgi:hypothetical protein
MDDPLPPRHPPALSTHELRAQITELAGHLVVHVDAQTLREGVAGERWTQRRASAAPSQAAYESSSTFPPTATVLMVSVRSVAKRNR